MQGGGFMMALLLSLILANGSLESAQGGPPDSPPAEECNGPDLEQRKRPSWRVAPYRPGAPSIYGGQYVVDTFGEHFDGPVGGDDWDLLWTSTFQVGELLKRQLPPRPGRLVNHCRYFKAAGQKCYFAGHVRRVEASLARDPALSAQLPRLRAHVLNHPAQAEQWLADARAAPERPWVVKTCNAGLSEGVWLLSGGELIAAAERWAGGQEAKSPWAVAQEYLERPYMGFGDRKFHLRVYVLVTRWSPQPSVLVFDEGLVFRSREPYQHDNLSEGRDIFSAIGSNVEAFSHATLWASLDAKSAARQAKAAIVQRPGSAEVRGRMTAAIRAIFGEALLESFGDAGETDPSRAGFACFDLFGLDVMFDEDLRPFVLEVNHGPNLQVDDRGEESEGLLGRVKAPLVAQLAAWAALRAQRAQEGATDERRTEDETLLNFTRVL